MSALQGQSVHAVLVTAQEGVRQTAVAAAGNSQSLALAADVNYYKLVLASAKASNNYSGVEAAIVALRSLQGTAT
jgi:hypothetical protein